MKREKNGEMQILGATGKTYLKDSEIQNVFKKTPFFSAVD
jgi:hypothetical protein